MATAPDAVMAHLEAMEGRLNQRLDKSDGRFDKVDRELGQIKTTLGVIKIETSALIDAVADINSRTAGS
ncbi:hypothetical protein [Candidatus Poriferisodalis sp.]|uniref:hypothetical protein n=1 Tax=Candidatus Poriferisodalis sp. TaxID=3101277 RepID=UPI003B51CC87